MTSGKQRYIKYRVLKVDVQNLLSPSFLFRWMLLDGVEQKTMHDLTYFRKDNSATLLRKKSSRKSKIEVGSLYMIREKLAMTWARISAEEVVRTIQQVGCNI